MVIRTVYERVEGMQEANVPTRNTDKTGEKASLPFRLVRCYLKEWLTDWPDLLKSFTSESLYPDIGATWIEVLISHTYHGDLTVPRHPGSNE